MQFGKLNKYLQFAPLKFVCVVLYACFIFALSETTYSVNQIKIEAKSFGSDVVFVFYHDNEHIVDVKNTETGVVVDTNVPMDYTIINQKDFDKFASNLRHEHNNQRVAFDVSSTLVFQSIINGEKLEAIKYKNTAPIVRDSNLFKIGAAKNDPDNTKYSFKGTKHHLSFLSKNSNLAAAAFIRGQNLWVIFDKKQLFTVKKQAVFQGSTIVPSENGTVMRISLSEEFADVEMIKSKNNWQLVLHKEKIENQKNSRFKPVALLNEDGYLIKGNFKDSEFVAFEDPDIGDIIKVLPLRESGVRINDFIEEIEYNILRTGQGLGFILKADEVSLEKFNEAVKITSDNELQEDIYVQSNLFPVSIEKYTKKNSLLPRINKKLDIIDFNQRRAQLTEKVTGASTASENFTSLLDLAKFYFVYQWYHEAADVLDLLKTKFQKQYYVSLEARVLNAISHTLIGESHKAQEEYSTLLSYYDVGKIPELIMWNKYNNFALGTSVSSINLLSNLRKIIDKYDDDKYWPLALAELEMQLNANNLEIAERIFKELRQPQEEYHNNSLKFFKATYYRRRGQLNLAKQFFQDLTYMKDDQFNYARATFELTKLKFDTKDINAEEASNILSELRYNWRGDQLEYYILLQLAKYQKLSRQPMEALRTYQYIQTAFLNKISNFYVTSEMVKIFNDVFLEGGTGDKMDDFSLVALFYEFKELNPIGEKGDGIIIEIARRLVKLDLLENASELLRHQIKFRLKEGKRLKVADNLAVILLMDNKPREAIYILDETDKDNINFEEYQYRLRLRARALIDMENFSKAVQLLSEDSSTDAQILKKEALFRNNEWLKYIEITSQETDDLINAIKTNQNNSKASAQDLLRLGIAYYKLGMLEQLDFLTDSIGTDTNQSLYSTLKLLASGTSNIDIHNLDKSLNVDQMQNLLGKYKQQFLGK